MSNQRYAGILRAGTNLTTAESAEIDAKIEAADKLLRQRRERSLREIDEENGRLLRMLEAGNARTQITGAA